MAQVAKWGAVEEGLQEDGGEIDMPTAAVHGLIYGLNLRQAYRWILTASKRPDAESRANCLQHLISCPSPWAERMRGAELWAKLSSSKEDVVVLW